MAYVFVLILGIVVGALAIGLLFINWMDRLKSTGAKQQLEGENLKRVIQAIKVKEHDLKILSEEIERQKSEFDAKVVPYQELDKENKILKRDLFNIDTAVRKTKLDVQLSRQKQSELDQRAVEIGTRHLNETEKWIADGLTVNTFATCKQRLLDAIERCRPIGIQTTAERESEMVTALKSKFELLVRVSIEKEEQARIKTQIREQLRFEREIEDELQEAEREKAVLQAALNRVLADTNERHEEEIQRLQLKLTEAEAKAQRAISRAQQTKAGNVYVISNLGAFGNDVFKIGMTRRLEPVERIAELSSASVPFPFDVHMMISCDDAPALENALHRSLHKSRINKVNPRKEFFRTDIATIKQIVEEQHGEVMYVADAEALQYRQSLTMSEEDAAYIENVYKAVEHDELAIEDV